MGAKDSKPSCISYEDAVKRVTESELRRIKDAFKRSTGTNGTLLSKTVFVQEINEGVPTVLADWLYTACGGTQKGIAFKELLCGLVLLTRGLPEEKIKFLWNVYCNDSGTHILKHEFTKALQIEETYQPASTARSVESQLVSHSVLLSLFANSDRVTFEQFKQWILRHERATVLSRWLLIDSGVNLSTELETPTFYQSLAGVTHLEEQDIGDLEKVFWQLKGSAKTGQLDLESLGPLITPPVPVYALNGVFSAFDENCDGHIDFKELCCGVSAACRGPNVERSKFCFKIFDIDRDGVLDAKEIAEMINILLLVAKESSASTTVRSLSYDQVYSELQDRAFGSNGTTGKLKSKASKESFTFTQEDFMMWSVQSQLNLLQPFLDLLFEVCHVVLGLRPQCRHLEYNIVKGWLAREVSRGYKVGQFWFLVTTDWWQNWQQHTQSQAAVSCSFCKTAVNYTIGRHLSNGSGNGANSLDEAVVCDESFTSNSTESMGDFLCVGDSSSLGSGSSGISCSGRNGLMPPGQIDNSSLIEPTTYKTVRTLTGEGGRLKRNSILSEHREYELVPDSLWKALSQWYRCNLPLPRQVIQPDSSLPLELELYPLNLRILRHQPNPPVAQTVSSWGAVAGGYGAVTSSGNYTSNAVSSVLQPPKRYLAYTAAFSRLATVKQVGEFLCQTLKLKSEDVRLWHVFNLEGSACLLEEDTATLQDLAIRDNDQILLETRNKDLTWPEELGSLSLTQSNYTAQERRATIASIQSLHAPGATGLHNLGNTCFMNSALQVLFNTQPLTQYFRQNMHLYELNTTNKLGTKGQLALRYAELLKEVWTASTRSIAPLKLRFCMTKHAPQFAGGGQHDSQELLEWMLDGLHEDLNRVTEKPYSELKDSDGRADSVVAAEAWAQHHARNQSVVIDLFYGQLKSKVSCMGCGRDSVRFDPFSLLSLPLPVENYTYCEVLVIRLDGSIPIKYGLRLNSDSKYSDFKSELSKLCHLDAKLMLVCELSNSQIRCALPDNQKLKVSTATELFVYEIPKGDFWMTRNNTEVVLNIEQGLKDIQRNPALQALPNDHQLTQMSTITIGSASSTASDDMQLISNGLKPFVSQSIAVNRTSKQSSGTGELSTSPDNTFSHANYTRKSSNAAKLLRTINSTGNDNYVNDLDEFSGTPSPTTTAATATAAQTSAVTIVSDTNSEQNERNERNNFDANATIIGKTTRKDVSVMGRHSPLPKIKTNKCDSIERNTTFLTEKMVAINCNCNNDNLVNGNSGDSGGGDNGIGGISSNNSDNFSDVNARDRKAGGYLIAVHRKLSRQDTYFLSFHKTRPSLFGVPLLIPCYEDGTNKDLYCAVWIQVARLLSPLPATPPDQSNHATDCDDSLGYEFPFILRAVSEGGRICALCPWSKFCRGCEIPCNDYPLLQGMLTHSNTPSPKLSHDNNPNREITARATNQQRLLGDGINPSAIQIAIDWDPTALHLRYQSTRERIWTEDESLALCRKQQVEPVDLDHCLRAFTSEEKLEEWYHCAHCKGKKPATKKLQIWKLPPILIVHLKRFNFVNNKWVKSQKVVNFPFKDFDPTPYLASVPQETILRHKELIEHGHKMNVSATINGSATDSDDQSSSDFSSGDHSIVNRIDETDVNDDDDDSGTVSPSHTSVVNNNNKNIQNNNRGNDGPTKSIARNASSNQQSTKRMTENTLQRRKRLVSTSLTKSPVIDGEFIDYHNHNLNEGQDPYDLKYRLYAVVSHSGMLNGGHYISYASNPNNSWYCYNDSSCREIHQQPNIDPGSAYLLFYERQGLNYSPYLPNVSDRTVPNGNILEVDDADSDLRKNCVIS